MSKYEDLKRKVAGKKKATKKKTSKKVAKKAAKKKVTSTKGLSTTAPDNGREVVKLASEIETRQFVREWARCEWDALQAVAKLHPELRTNELERVAGGYRRSPHFEAALLDVLKEIHEVVLTQESAEEILSRHATTSVLDFFEDSGKVKSIAEMRKMPRHAQLAIKKLKCSVVEDLNDDGSVKRRTHYAEIEAYDAQKAIEQLARMKEWGVTAGQDDLARMLRAAEARLHGRVIDLDEIDPED